MTTGCNTRVQRVASRGIAETGVSGRRFAGMVTAAAVALALVLGAALPARADRSDDLAKALLGALVIGVIVNELDDRSKPEPVRRPRVPAVCEIAIDGKQRSVSLYSENCLRREGFDHRLPRGCANAARIFGRSDRVYSAQCLREAGFRVSGR